MLILVGVTVTVALNGGLFEKAREGATKTTLERQKEELTVAVASAYDIETGTIKKDGLITALGEKWEVNGNDGGPYSVISPDGNTTFTVKKDGTITSRKTPKAGTIAALYCDNEECTESTHLHKGDYILYTPQTDNVTYKPDGDVAGNLTGYEDGVQEIGRTELNWRIMGQDEEGNILLISGTPTENVIRFKGYIGYNNYEKVLDDTCEALYSNNELGAKARSITMQDIDTYLGNATMEETDEYYGKTLTISSKYDYNSKTNKLTKLSEGETKELELTDQFPRSIFIDENGDNLNFDILMPASALTAFGGGYMCLPIKGWRSEYEVWSVGFYVWWSNENGSMTGGFSYLEMAYATQDASTKSCYFRPVIVLPGDLNEMSLNKQSVENESWTPEEFPGIGD